MAKTHLLLLLILSSISAFGQDSISVSSNQNGLVEYTTKTDSGAHIFTLYGDGEFGVGHQPKHKFDTSSTGYLTETFFVKAYDKNLPPKKTLSTGSIGSGSSHTNPVMKMSGEVDLLISWATAEGYENYFIVAFRNSNSSTAVSGCVEFHYHSSELSIDSLGIREYNNWVKNRAFSASSGKYTHKVTWDFSSLKQHETRYIYVPARVNAKVSSKLNLLTNYKVNCTGGGSSSSKSSTFLVRRFPHDPNFKIVDRTCLKPNAPAQRLEYTIGFFNDGHDFARDVHIQDTLSHWLISGTADTLDYEYEPSFSIHHSALGDVLVIDFWDIYLPGINQRNSSVFTALGPSTEAYSYEDAFSHVSFSVCAVQELQTSICIENLASIVFDNLPAILTEPAIVCTSSECLEFEPCMVNGLRTQASENEPLPALKDLVAIQLSPNPVTESLHVSLAFGGVEGAIARIELWDYSGKMVKELYQGGIEAGGFHQQYDLSDMPAGIYLVSVYTAYGRYNRKFVKQ